MRNIGLKESPFAQAHLYEQVLIHQLQIEVGHSDL